MNEEFDRKLLESMIQLRREVHQYPELSRQEKETSKRIIRVLQSLGIDVQVFKDHYGVCGTVQGQGPGPVIALRADMDALPITEPKNKSYSSKVPGVMHACGHDGHVAILLGVAELLVKNRQHFQGSVKLIFQPAEEAAPIGGSKLMIADGVLEHPKVDAIFGLHLWPSLPCGSIGIKPGPLMAGSDRFSIKLLGKSAHVGMPHKGLDAIMMAMEVIQSFNNMMTRQMNPLDIATLSIGKITGGERYNIIAKEAFLEGTIRTFSSKVRQIIPEHMKRIMAGVTEAHGGEYVFDYQPGYPILNNWAGPTSLVAESARQVIDEKCVLKEIEPNLGGEDFARYLEKVPGALFWLGASKPGEEGAPLHNQDFEIDESALLIGAKIMFRTVCNALDFYKNK